MKNSNQLITAISADNTELIRIGSKQV
jgi:hypothetical protein